jgi:hypothetical protein
MSSQRSSKQSQDAGRLRDQQPSSKSKLSLTRSSSSEDDSAVGGAGGGGGETFSPLPTLLRRDASDLPTFNTYLPKRGSFNLPIAPDSAATSSLRSNNDLDVSPHKLKPPHEDSSTMRRELSLEEDSDPEDRPAPGYG